MAKRTKIVATIGPASVDKKILEAMIRKGMNVARLNFSHGEYAFHETAIKNIREIGKDLHCPVGILADLQGPRIRILVDQEVEIKEGATIKFCDVSDNPKSQILNPKSQINSNNPNSKNKIICLDVPGIIQDININEAILIEDGLIRLKVTKKEKDFLEAEVINGGIIKNHKGVNLPDSQLHIKAFTEKDERDLNFALEHDTDFVALSFVSNGKEIEEVREKIKKILKREPARNATLARNDQPEKLRSTMLAGVATSSKYSVAGGDNLPQIISKIERKEAIKNIDEIIKASDAVMVARGDLGIELNESKVVIYQKEIIGKCLEMVKPVIVATQMLDSMINNPLPTRAEVSDVSNAVIDHTDAVMLSGETANGKFPLKVIETMAEIIKDTEESPFDDINPSYLDDNIFSDYASLIDGAHEMGKSSGAKAILMVSESGFTAKMVSHHRPDQLLLVATGNQKTFDQLSLIWGVRAYLFSEADDREKFLELLVEKAKEEGKLSSGDKAVVILGRFPGGEKMKLIGIKVIE